MDLGYSYFLTGLGSLDSFMKTKLRVKASINGLTVGYMMVNGKIIKCMDKVF